MADEYDDELDPKDAETEVVEQGARTNFTMMPNCIWSMASLSNSAARLYMVYKGVCGDGGGVCWASDATISQIVGALSPNTIIKARKELVDLGLVKVKRIARSGGGHRLRVTIIDIWSHNGIQESPLKTKKPTPPPQKLRDEPTRKNCGSTDAKIVVSPTQKLRTTNTTVNKTTAKILSPGGDGAMMGEGFLKEKAAGPDDAMIAARRLYDGLAAKRKIMRPPNMTAWAAAIRKFLKTSGLSPVEFIAVMNWYIDNLTRPFVPLAFSASAFVDKYVQIETAMSRLQHAEQAGLLSVDETLALIAQRGNGAPAKPRKKEEEKVWRVEMSAGELAAWEANQAEEDRIKAEEDAEYRRQERAKRQKKKEASRG
jgi:hypothetical protein